MFTEWDKLQELLNESSEDERFNRLFLEAMNGEVEFLLNENASLLLEADLNIWEKFKQFFIDLRSRIKKVGDNFLKNSVNQAKKDEEFLASVKDKLLSLSDTDIGNRDLIPYWNGTEVWKAVTVPSFNPDNFMEYKDGKAIIGHVVNSVNSLKGVSPKDFSSKLHAALQGGESTTFGPNEIKKRIPSMIKYCETYKGVYTRLKMDQKEIDNAVAEAISEVEKQISNFRKASQGQNTDSSNLNNLAVKVNESYSFLLENQDNDKALENAVDNSTNHFGSEQNKPSNNKPSSNSNKPESNKHKDPSDKITDAEVDSAIQNLQQTNPAKNGEDNKNKANSPQNNTNTQQQNNQQNPNNSQPNTNTPSNPDQTNGAKPNEKGVKVKDEDEGRERITAYKDYAKFCGFILSQKMEVAASKYTQYMSLFKKLATDESGKDGSETKREKFEKLDKEYHIDRELVNMKTKSEGQLKSFKPETINSEVYQTSICIANTIERATDKTDLDEIKTTLIEYEVNTLKLNRQIFDKYKVNKKFNSFKAEFSATGSAAEKRKRQLRSLQQFNNFIRGIFSSKPIKEKEPKSETDKSKKTEENDENK